MIIVLAAGIGRDRMGNRLEKLELGGRAEDRLRIQSCVYINVHTLLSQILSILIAHVGRETQTHATTPTR